MTIPFGLDSRIVTLLKIIRRIIRCPISFPLGLIIRSLGFRVLPVSYTRIGHLICETDCLMKEVALQRIKPRRWLIFYNSLTISNPAYLELLPDYFFPVATNKFCLKIIQNLLYTKLLTTEVYQYVTAIHTSASIYTIQADWGDRGATIHCPEKWIEAKNQVLECHGVFSGQPYVCIHARDSAYSLTDEYVHYKRNINISSYNLAVEYLISCGYAVIRMGHSKMIPLSQELSKVFDYARSSEQSPWLDLAISADCSFS